MFIKLLIIFFICTVNINAFAENNRIIIASTTSTNDTGLLDHINKEFQKKFNINIDVLSLGTGQAIRVAKNGDADILLVHHSPSEFEFIKNGYGIERHKLMYNNYIIIGPKNDVNQCDSIESTLLRIKNNELIFISRSDESGTHLKEKDLWKKIDYDTEKFSSWYIKIGQGMGAALLMANELKGYTLTDSATWMSFNNKKNIKIICKNKPPLLNQYGIIAVNGDINPRINLLGAKKYINWIISEEGKKLINGYTINNMQLFFFNHH